MWEKLLDQVASSIIRFGTLEVVLPSGRRARYGDGTGGPVRIRLVDTGAIVEMVKAPEMALGELYMDERLILEEGDLRDLLAICVANIGAGGAHWLQAPLKALRFATRNLKMLNSLTRARSNVAHHYDLSADLYALFLDEDRQYSCAYFERPGLTLEAAQAAKKRHIAGKLLIEPGMTVLDIGCGWGGMGLTLARDYGARVVGVTLSEEQLKIARARAEAEGLSDRVDFRLTDYRALTETFDRVVSVGMFEHVGVPHYREYFDHVHDLLHPDGVALIHTIGRTSPPGITSPWVEKYIFPGGYIPSLSEMMAPIETARLYTTDVEIWRLHYAETLRHWYDRFTARADEARRLYDDRFVRMWSFYLAAAEMTFRHNWQCVFQVQLAHDQEAVPLTRDYLYRDAARGSQADARTEDGHRHAAE